MHAYWNTLYYTLCVSCLCTPCFASLWWDAMLHVPWQTNGSTHNLYSMFHSLIARWCLLTLLAFDIERCEKPKDVIAYTYSYLYILRKNNPWHNRTPTHVCACQRGRNQKYPQKYVHSREFVDMVDGIPNICQIFAHLLNIGSMWSECWQNSPQTIAFCCTIFSESKLSFWHISAHFRVAHLIWLLAPWCVCTCVPVQGIRTAPNNLRNLETNKVPFIFYPSHWITNSRDRRKTRSINTCMTYIYGVCVA